MAVVSRLVGPGISGSTSARRIAPTPSVPPNTLPVQRSAPRTTLPAAIARPASPAAALASVSSAVEILEGLSATTDVAKRRALLARLGHPGSDLAGSIGLIDRRGTRADDAALCRLARVVGRLVHDRIEPTLVEPIARALEAAPYHACKAQLVSELSGRGAEITKLARRLEDAQRYGAAAALMSAYAAVDPSRVPDGAALEIEHLIQAGKFERASDLLSSFRRMVEGDAAWVARADALDTLIPKDGPKAKKFEPTSSLGIDPRTGCEVPELGRQALVERGRQMIPPKIRELAAAVRSAEDSHKAAMSRFLETPL